MEKIKIFQVDAFTDRLFAGNPAAVCLLNEWIDEGTMQAIGAENNLSETAFIVRRNNHFEIRWFTPAVEVELCGHATLAAAFIIFNHLDFGGDKISFHTLHRGIVNVSKTDDVLYLDFPTDRLTPVEVSEDVQKAIEVPPVEIYKGRTDLMVVLEGEEVVSNLKPNFEKLAALHGRGIIVTAQGTSCDFVSRFFAPQSGINEDPVTGSAHTTLIPYWSKKLGKKEMLGKQVSQRGGNLYCTDKGDRVIIGGKARLFLAGEINVNQAVYS